MDPGERLRTRFELLHDIFTPAVAVIERDVTAAKLLAMQGRFDEAWAIQRRALGALRQLRFQVPQTANALAITTGSAARFRWADLELELGDPDVARGLCEGIVSSFAPSDKFYVTSAYERLGRIHEAVGRV